MLLLVLQGLGYKSVVALLHDVLLWLLVPLMLDDQLDLGDELVIIVWIGKAHDHRVLIDTLVSTEDELDEV